MGNQPCSHGRNLAVGHECDDPAPLQIAHDAAVAMIAAPRPVIDADDVQSFVGQTRAPPSHPQECVVADWHHQSLGQTDRRPAAQRQTEVMNDTFEPRCPPAALGHHISFKLLSKYTMLAECRLKDKPAGCEPQPNLSAGTRQVGTAPDVSAVDAARGTPAATALPPIGSRACGNKHLRSLFHSS